MDPFEYILSGRGGTTTIFPALEIEPMPLAWVESALTTEPSCPSYYWLIGWGVGKLLEI